MASVMAPSYNALVELEKGSLGSPRKQLREAARIIAVDLDEQNTDVNPASPSNISAPKEEWVLRWLIKKMRVSKSDDGGAAASYRSDKYSWILLRVLIDKIPPKPLAVILGENKLSDILVEVLQEVSELAQTQPHEAYATAVEMLGSPTTAVPPKRGRKRKRAEEMSDDESMSGAASNGSSSASWLDLFVTLLEAIYQFTSLVSRVPVHQAAIRSQLKLVLKNNANSAATIMGLSLSFAGDAVVELSGPASADVARLRRRLLRSLLSTMTIWDLRSPDDSSKPTAKESFVLHALSPALQLLLRLRTAKSLADTQNIVQNLERLIVLHVVLPLRERFFSLVQSQGPGFFQTILEEIDNGLSNHTRQEKVPVLLDIAVRAVPRDTFRRQLNEESWLETLFVVFATRIGCAIGVGEASIMPPNWAIDLLQQLLQVFINRKIRLSASTLSKCAIQFSGLASTGETPIHWSLIAQLIELNVDVFLPNSGYPEAQFLLDGLVDRITKEYFYFRAPEDSTSAVIKTGILVPLLRGFAGVRDLDTFIRIWNYQLSNLELTRESTEDPHLYAFWEDDILLKAYGDTVSTSSSDQHLKDYVENIIPVLNGGKKSQHYNKIIFIDALLMSNQCQDESFIDRQLFSRLYDILSCFVNGEYVHWQWRIWRIAQNLFNKFSSAFPSPPTDLADSLLQLAVTKSHQFSASECREAYYAFQFLASTLTTADIPKTERYLDQAVSSVSNLFSDLQGTAAWNGQTETLQDSQTVAIGFLTVLLADPPIMGKLSSESRRSLFNAILSSLSKSRLNLDIFSSGDGNPVEKLSSQLLEIWTGFASADWTLAAAPVVYDLASVIAAKLPNDQAMRPLLLKSLLSIPPRLIPAHLRVSITDLIQDIAIDNRDAQDEQLDFLSLLKRFVELPKSSSRLVTSWESVWKIADSISLGESHDTQSLIRAFSQLFKAVTDRVAVSAESSRREYIENTLDKVSSLSNQFSSDSDKSMVYIMFCLSINWIHKNQADLGTNATKSQVVDSLRQTTFQHSVEVLQSLARQSKKRKWELDETYLLVTLVALDTFPDLLGGNKDARKAIQKLDEQLEQGYLDARIRRVVKCQRVARVKGAAGLLPEVLNSAPNLHIQHLYRGEEFSFVNNIRKQVSSMSGKKLSDLLLGIGQEDFYNAKHAAHKLLLAGIAIASFAPVESRESPEAAALSFLFTTLADSLPKFTSPEPFCLATECIDLLLRTHPRCVSQWNIDNLLAAISITTSHSGPQISREYAGTVYTRLSRLIGTVFGLYRKKVSGRFHLILPPLQRLLRCLFSRDSRASKASPLQSELPPWFGNTDESPLTVEHAGQYCRLLTSLSDPTVSAVQLQRGSQANNALSDGTKKVKSLAGQYLQYLIIEYAGAQLRGHLSPEVKAALMPGLYSVLDVISRKTMRAMNAAMDSSSRATFKSLYDDYIRFGKWNNE